MPCHTAGAAGHVSGSMELTVTRGVGQVVEDARRNRLVGASLEARVLLHVDAPPLAASLAAWNELPNGADPLRYAFIVSQALPGLQTCPVHAMHSPASRMPMPLNDEH